VTSTRPGTSAPNRDAKPTRITLTATAIFRYTPYARAPGAHVRRQATT
jgi:hypothetical protein